MCCIIERDIYINQLMFVIIENAEFSVARDIDEIFIIQKTLTD